jgi:hypothetical protein
MLILFLFLFLLLWSPEPQGCEQQATNPVRGDLIIAQGQQPAAPEPPAKAGGTSVTLGNQTKKVHCLSSACGGEGKRERRLLSSAPLKSQILNLK